MTAVVRWPRRASERPSPPVNSRDARGARDAMIPTLMLISPTRIVLLAATVLGVGCNPAGRPATASPSATAAKSASEAVPPASISFTGDEATVAAKRAFVQETCTMMADAGDPKGRHCEAVQDLGDWLVLRSSDAIHDGMRWRWFIGALMDDGRFVLLVSEDADFPREDYVPQDAYYELCEDTTTSSVPPVDTGLVAVEVTDITGDGRADLRLECEDTDIRGDHYSRICVGGHETCTEPKATGSCQPLQARQPPHSAAASLARPRPTLAPESG